MTLPEVVGSTLDAISEGVQIIGFDWRYLYLNEAACRHGRCDRAELLGRTMQDCYPGIDGTALFATLSACMRDRAPRRLDNELRYADGGRSLFELRVQPCPQGIFVMSLDVTAQRALDAKLQQVQKMDAVGRLAGGLAHDFNNLLTAAQGFTTFAAELVGHAHEARADLDEVLAIIDRAAGLTRQLLSFSRHQPPAPRIVDVNATLTSLEKLLAQLLREDIELVLRVSDEPWRSLIDPGALEQVVVNLVVNGRDAMPKGGRLTIETLNLTIDEPQALSHGRVVPPGDYVVVAVTDDGVGMEPALRERIFEPFFTTKPAGKGTGLGLATCHGIVRQAGGYIWVYSEPGQGSTFKIYLPRARAAAPHDERRPPAHVTGGHETILLVEDNAQVRTVAERTLRAAGYRVLSVGEPQQALAACAEVEGEIDLLLTDVTMPGGDGHGLAAQLRRRCAQLRVMYISGYTETVISRRGGLPPGTAMLSKPFTPGALARKVREVLDAAVAEDEPWDAERPRVMVIDDDEMLRRAARRQLEQLGCEALVVSDLDRAVEQACEQQPAAVLMDLRMPGIDGQTLLRRMAVAGVQASVIVMSGDGGVDDVVDALRGGAVDYLRKPWTLQDLDGALRRAVAVHRAVTTASTPA